MTNPWQLLRDEGYPLFLIEPPIPGREKGSPGDGKTPMKGQSWPGADALPEHCGNDWNAGLPTGTRSGTVVLDLDDPEAEAWALAEVEAGRLPETPFRVSTRRGSQWFYKRPDVPYLAGGVNIVPDRPDLHVDLRADGNYVVALGSTHGLIENDDTGQFVVAPREDHVPYELEEGASIGAPDQLPLLPEWIYAGRVSEKRKDLERASPIPNDPATAEVLARARLYAATSELRPEGQGSDDKALALAQALRVGFGLSHNQAVGVILERAKECGHTWDARWVSRKVTNAELYSDTIPYKSKLEAAKKDTNLPEADVFACENVRTFSEMRQRGEKILAEGIPYVVEGMIPSFGMAGFMVGYAKLGKSTLGIRLAGSIANGNDFLERHVTKKKVLYLGLEDPEEYLAVMVAKAGVSSEDSKIYSGYFALNADNEKKLAEYIETEGFGFIYVATWTTWMYGLVESENDNAAIAKAVATVKRLARRTGVPHLLEAHAGKEEPGKEINPVKLLRGASAGGGEIDYVLAITHAGGNKRRLAGLGRFVSEFSICYELYKDEIILAAPAKSEASMSAEDVDRDLLVRTTDALTVFERGLSTSALETQIRVKKGSMAGRLEIWAQQGFISSRPGRSSRSRVWILTSNPSRIPPSGSPMDLPGREGLESRVESPGGIRGDWGASGDSTFSGQLRDSMEVETALQKPVGRA